LLVFGKCAGESAAKYAKENKAGTISEKQVEQIMQEALAPFVRESNPDKENPYQIQSDLQEMMQDLVGFVRLENELKDALNKLDQLKVRASKASCGGNRNYNPGWHTAIELKHMLTVAEAIAQSAIERKESRGGHFRDDFPDKSEEFGNVNIALSKDENGKMKNRRIPKVKLRE